MNDPPPNPIILYDGVCGLCDRLVAMVLRKDKHGQFRFASLQSPFGRRILERHNLALSSLDTVYLVLDYGRIEERLLDKSDALIAILRKLGGFWIAEAALLRVAPKAIRDRIYEGIAQHRYRFFGRYDACIIPHPRYREKFLDQQNVLPDSNTGSPSPAK